MQGRNRQSPRTTSSLAADLAWFGRLISHEIRVEILANLSARPASATQVAAEIGEPMTTVAYHVRLLADQGALELVSEGRRRGGLERTYRLSERVRQLAQLGNWPYS